MRSVYRFSVAITFEPSHVNKKAERGVGRDERLSTPEGEFLHLARHPYLHIKAFILYILSLYLSRALNTVTARLHTRSSFL